MNLPLLSIIVITYNHENYIKKCADSLVCQLTDDVEVIFIDDGSIDNTFDILNPYSSDNVHVIHKDNGGIVSARWEGLKFSKGKYIMFIDGDDWIDSSCLNSIFDVLNKYEDLDMICFGYNEVKESININHSLNLKAGFYDENMIKEFIDPIAICDSKGNMFPCAVWAKVYKKNIIVNGYVSDFKIAMGEDAASTPVCLMNSKSIYIIDDLFYFYRSNSSSFTNCKKSYDPKGPYLRKVHLQNKLSDNERVKGQIDRQIVLALYTMVKSHLNATAGEILSKKELKDLLNRREYRESIENVKFDFCTKSYIKKILLKFKILQLIKVL